jgi:hypothetical protein
MDLYLPAHIHLHGAVFNHKSNFTFTFKFQINHGEQKIGGRDWKCDAMKRPVYKGDKT